MAGQLDPIWVPSATDIARARVTASAEFAARTYDYRGSSYLDLWQWSVTKLDDFWEAQALNPYAKSPSKIASPGAAS